MECKTTALILTKNDNNDIFSRYSSLIKLIRVVAHCFRFYENCKIKRESKKRKIKQENENCRIKLLFGPLQVHELNNACLKLIKISQYESFINDINAISRKEPINKSSILKTLNPFLDETGVLRVGGRLKYSNLSYYKCYPIILPKKHLLTNLISRYEHLKLYHCGSQMLLNTMRNNYWPMGGRNLTRMIVRNCITCSK